jgi:3-deoxy-D-manno-octulosonic-acid transferase
MYFLYSLVTALGMLLAAPYFLFTGFRRGQSFAALRQRFGWAYPPQLHTSQSRSIWIHAVSVGEVLAVVPLALRLQERFPDRRLVVSTTTVTGQRLALERLPFAGAVFYFPLDWRGPVRRAIRAARPELILVAETEIWPNFLREARRENVPVAFVNGRLSARSYRGFLRARSLKTGLLANFQKRVLADASLYLMQSEADAGRLLDLGAPRDRVVVTGNLKYDLATPRETDLSRWLVAEMRRAERGPLVVAGSVLAGEETQVLAAFGEIEKQWPAALLVLAPRKPDRFDAAAAEVQNSGREVVRRSELPLDATLRSPLALPTSVFLLDSVGELASLYALADAVFVGGSLVPGGGHNILEPAVVGRPPVFGPSMHNFKDVAARFLESKAALQVVDSAQLAAAWTTLIGDAPRREQMGAAARDLVERYRGATEKVLMQVVALLESRGELAATARGDS